MNTTSATSVPTTDVTDAVPMTVEALPKNVLCRATAERAPSRSVDPSSNLVSEQSITGASASTSIRLRNVARPKISCSAVTGPKLSAVVKSAPWKSAQSRKRASANLAPPWNFAPLNTARPSNRNEPNPASPANSAPSNETRSGNPRKNDTSVSNFAFSKETRPPNRVSSNVVCSNEAPSNVTDPANRLRRNEALSRKPALSNLTALANTASVKSASKNVTSSKTTCPGKRVSAKSARPNSARRPSMLPTASTSLPTSSPESVVPRRSTSAPSERPWKYSSCCPGSRCSRQWSRTRTPRQSSRSHDGQASPMRHY